MNYGMKKMTLEIWEDVSSKISESLRKRAIAQGWPEVVLSEGIAVNDSGDSWLCRSPNFTGELMSRWFMFHLEGETYCFKIVGVTDPRLEFFHPVPTLQTIGDFKKNFMKAFAVYGLYGLGESNHFTQPTIPDIEGE